mmetsp:Transcript_24552/g.53181  ORF Transcript_24552/g.53181 Transcript_24552/m.53181 type:complete len:270 (-) Transcript_24552:27-836(-)
MKVISVSLFCSFVTSGTAQYFYTVPEFENVTIHDLANLSREDPGVVEMITNALTVKTFIQTTVAVNGTGLAAFVSNYSTYRFDSFEEIRDCFQSKQRGCSDVVTTSPELLGKKTVTITKILRTAPVGNVLRCHIPPNDLKSVHGYCHTNGIYTGYRSDADLRGYKGHKGHRFGDSLGADGDYSKGSRFHDGSVVYAEAQHEGSSSTFNILMACHGTKDMACHLLAGYSFVAFNKEYPEFPGAVAVRIPLEHSILQKRSKVLYTRIIYYP